MAFKQAADFQHFISVGAVGAAQVSRHLRNEYQHRPVELERYALANKLWATKVKRMRLPDLVCLRCGRRVESRGKDKRLGMIVSDAATDGRAWNSEGMRESDLYAFVKVDMSGEQPRGGHPAFFTTGALHKAYGLKYRSNTKAASEGYETSIEWRSWVPTWSGTFIGLDEGSRIVCEKENGYQRSYGNWLNWDARYLYLSPGDTFKAGERIVAGLVAPPTDLPCPGDTWDLSQAITDEEDTERYAAVKAAGILGRHDMIPSLEGMLEGAGWRLYLETLVSLARLDPAKWASQIIDRIDGLVESDEGVARAGAQMESVLAVSEIAHDDAVLSLKAVANDTEQDSELRAAAAWGMGRGANPRPDLLLPLALADDERVSLHAIVGMSALPEHLTPQVVGWLGSADDRVAAVARTILVRHRAVRPLLRVVAGGGQAALWALNALGDLPPEVIRDAGADDLDTATEERLEPLWLAQRDWLHEPRGRDGLEALDVQTVRFDPTDPV